MYKIKQLPADFLVQEIPKYEETSGDYALFWMKKKDHNTLNALKILAIKLHIPIKNIGYAGNKDKVAITEQVISIRAIKKERVEKLKLEDIELKYIGQSKNPISLGDLIGNKFNIVVRNLPNLRLYLRKPENIPNLYGPQRFSKNNAEIGKYIVQKNFRKAVDLIDNRSVKEAIDRNPGDPIGALRTLTPRLRKIYIHAYQSQLWNETVNEYIEDSPGTQIQSDSTLNEHIPIIGFGTAIQNNKVSMVIRKILNKERLSIRDFIIPQMPEISAEGGERQLYITPENFKIETKQDELNTNKQKAIVQFSLPKGSYATVVIDYLFNR